MHWGVAMHFQRIPEHRLHRSGATQLRNRASVYAACRFLIPFATIHLGLTLKWLAIHCHLPPRFIQVSVKRPRRSQGLPLSIPFS